MLFCPVPGRPPAPLQKPSHKQNQPSENANGNPWQKERRRREINPLLEGTGAEATSHPGRGSEFRHKHDRAIFIPLTWLTRTDGPYYSTDDPDWQEFVALSRDKKRKKDVKDRLSALACAAYSSHNDLTKVIGQPLELYAVWLDFDYPLREPARYCRSGILWTDDELQWATAKYANNESQRSLSILRPTPLLYSLQVLSASLLNSYYTSLKSLWSRSENPVHQSSADKPVFDPIPLDMRQAESEGPSSANVQINPSTTKHTLPTNVTSTSPVELFRRIMPKLEPDSAISAAGEAFQQNFLDQWRKSLLTYPQGVCFLRGEIGLKGPGGFCKISIKAAYLPKLDLFVHIATSKPDIFPRAQEAL